MQSVSSRIWTHVAVSISYDDNHYTTGTSFVGYVMPKPFFSKNSSGYYLTHNWDKFLLYSYKKKSVD